MCCLSCCRRNQRSLAKEIRCVSLDLPQTVQKPSRPVLKITRWVLIGCENPLLYSILCALSRKGVLTRFASFLSIWAMDLSIYHVFITAHRIIQLGNLFL
jgi:hypothetical protein